MSFTVIVIKVGEEGLELMARKDWGLAGLCCPLWPDTPAGCRQQELTYSPQCRGPLDPSPHPHQGISLTRCGTWSLTASQIRASAKSPETEGPARPLMKGEEGKGREGEGRNQAPKRSSASHAHSTAPSKESSSLENPALLLTHAIFQGRNLRLQK